MFFTWLSDSSPDDNPELPPGSVGVPSFLFPFLGAFVDFAGVGAFVDNGGAFVDNGGAFVLLALFLVFFSFLLLDN